MDRQQPPYYDETMEDEMQCQETGRHDKKQLVPQPGPYPLQQYPKQPYAPPRYAQQPYPQHQYPQEQYPSVPVGSSGDEFSSAQWPAGGGYAGPARPPPPPSHIVVVNHRPRSDALSTYLKFRCIIISVILCVKVVVIAIVLGVIYGSK